jgi:hypothetical protein
MSSPQPASEKSLGRSADLALVSWSKTSQDPGPVLQELDELLPEISQDPGPVLQELDELLPEILKLTDKSARANHERVRAAVLNRLPRLAHFACHRLPARLFRALDLVAAELLGMPDLGPKRAVCRVVLSSLEPTSEEEVRRVFQRYGAVQNVVLGAGHGSVQYESAEHAETALADAQSIHVCGRIPRSADRGPWSVTSRSRPSTATTFVSA